MELLIKKLKKDRVSDKKIFRTPTKKTKDRTLQRNKQGTRNNSVKNN